MDLREKRLLVHHVTAGLGFLLLVRGRPASKIKKIDRGGFKNHCIIEREKIRLPAPIE